MKKHNSLKKILLFFCSTLILITVTSTICKAQVLDSASANNVAKKIFKDEFVEKKFKDPYSYELLKIESTPITLEDKTTSELMGLIMVKAFTKLDTVSRNSMFLKQKKIVDQLSKSIKNGEKLKGENPEKYQKKYGETIKKHKEAVSMLDAHRKLVIASDQKINDLQDILKSNKDELNKTAGWKIKLDCYGANSYGGKILGRYTFDITLSGELNGEIEKTN